jgi:DNA polymerase
MKTLEIDIETYSAFNLSKTGVYKYVESPSFLILLFGYSVDGGEVHVVDLASGEKIPEDIIKAIKDEKVIKIAHNANFERVCLSRYLDLPEHQYLSPSSWRCTMVWAAYLGLPLSLKDVGTVLGLEKQKLEEGKNLIRVFCVPNRKGERTLPEEKKEDWELFQRYNKRDVETEMEIMRKLSRFPVPESVWEEYHIDQEINDRGTEVDMTLVESAIEMDQRSRKELMDRMQSITELENPNSVQQLRGWLGMMGQPMDTLGKKEVAKAMENASGDVKEVLRLRGQLAKSSVKKYQAMQNAVCSDGRVRGMFQFYGATHTGRFASKIVQLQNLPQNHLPDLAEAREMVRQGNYEMVKMLYENVPDTLSQLIRTAFIASPGNLFYVADYSAIECRVLAWLAGEQWVLDSFIAGKDIYCETASMMYHVPVEKHGINGDLRQKGKRAVLGCGYGGSVGALIAMGALDDGMKEEELKPIVDAYRQANPHIVKFWYDVDRAAKAAIKKKTTTTLRNLVFAYQSGFLFITLPSGRRLAYAKPRIGENKFGGESITYEAVSGGKWTRLETYGATLTENIVQGTARDILCNAMRNLREKRICMHVHDELIIEGTEDLNQICEAMAIIPDWGEGLALRADGYTTPFYMKD